MNRRKVENLLTSVEDEAVKKSIVDGVMDLYGDSVEAKDTKIATLENDIKVKESLIDDLNTKIKEADKVDIEAIKKEQYDLGKADGSKEVETFKQDEALKEAIGSYKARDVSVVSKLIEREKLRFEPKDDTYEIKGLEEQMKDLKENKSFLFDEEQRKQEDISFGDEHNSQVKDNESTSILGALKETYKSKKDKE